MNIKNILVMLRLMKEHCRKLAIHIKLNFTTVAILKFTMMWMAVGIQRLGSIRWRYTENINFIEY